jgi:monofunctional biosynthetic peptidoglycan transglycosylase
LRWLRILVLFFFVSTVAAVLFFRFVPPPCTPLMLLRCFARIADGHFPKLDKDWTSLDGISPRLAEAVVASEDQLFFDHHGFDWDAIRSAFSVNGRGKRKLGASTITQQTAKNLFLWPDRSWTRKGLEAYFTLLLELLWSKRRILEVYLNVIETGDGTYGAEAAARRYFHVSASGLTAPQSALIAATLPNPRAWSPANPTGYLRRRQTWILRQMAQLGPMPDGLSKGGPKPAGGSYASQRPRETAVKPDGKPQGGPLSQPPQATPAGRDTGNRENAHPNSVNPGTAGPHAESPDQNLLLPPEPPAKPYPDVSHESESAPSPVIPSPATAVPAPESAQEPAPAASPAP